MTIPRMESVSKRWDSIPPLSVLVAMVAGALGVKVGKPEKSENSLQDLIDMAGPAGLSSEVPDWAREQHG